MANTKIKGSNIEANAIDTGHFHTSAFTGLNQHLIPDTNSVYDLGTAEYKWRDLYLSSATIYLGDNTKMSVDGDGNLEVKDENDNPKPIKAKSLEIDDVNADPNFKTVMKKVNGKMKFVKVNRATGVEDADHEEVDLGMNSIGDLKDVDLTVVPTLNQTIIWNGTSFVPGESFSQSDFNTAFAAKTVGDLSDGSSYATTSYVDTEVAGIVSSAPATLDTLNELAAALGDDPNFATTVSNQIGTKWTQDNTKISNWDTAYGWGNHGSAGYATTAYVDSATSSIDLSGYLPLTGGTVTGNLTLNGDKLNLPTGTTDPSTGIQAGSSYFNTADSTLRVYDGTEWGSITIAPLGSAQNPAPSAMALTAEGLPDGWYWVTFGSNPYYVYCKLNTYGGGWVLMARVRRENCQDHITSSALNLSGTTGPDPNRTGSSQKFADSLINTYVSSNSTYSGPTRYWLESEGWSNGSGPKNMFVDSNATVDLVSSADGDVGPGDNNRTRVSTTYEGSISDRGPNGGTRGFGDHHTSGGTYFAWGRHPEYGGNCGFREDNLGEANGWLWVK